MLQICLFFCLGINFLDRHCVFNFLETCQGLTFLLLLDKYRLPSGQFDFLFTCLLRFVVISTLHFCFVKIFLLQLCWHKELKPLVKTKYVHPVSSNLWNAEFRHGYHYYLGSSAAFHVGFLVYFCNHLVFQIAVGILLGNTWTTGITKPAITRQLIWLLLLFSL